MTTNEKNLISAPKNPEPIFADETPFKRYKRFELALKYLRAGLKEEHPEDMGLYEEDLLSMMDLVWQQLTNEERTILNAEGPQTWPEK